MDKVLNVFSLWAIDDLEDTELLKKQLKDFLSLGFNGVVFHPRRYYGNIKYLSGEYMDILSELILYSKSLELDFWIYDENGWPSGSADGQVIKNMPDLKCKWLEYADGSVVIKEKNGINSLDKKGVEEFVSITHEGYKNGLCKEAFEYIGGFFSDEVGFLEGHGACMDRGGIPWRDEIAVLYDGDITTKLPELFSPKESGFKIWYWEKLTELLSENFYGVIEKWCSENGKLYTAHLKGEENPFFQLGYSGSCFQVLKNISVPGIDALERYPGNKFYPRIASSLSKQFGNGMAMAEAMGGAGWGLTPADVDRYTQWLIRSGINFVIFHINQLHLTYDSITDWPSSIPCHQPWREAFPALIDRMRENVQKQKASDLLVICPTRGTMNSFSPEMVQGMNEHDGSHQIVNKASDISHEIVNICECLYNKGANFDLTDEKLFEDYGIVCGDEMMLGKCRYKNVIVASGCRFSEKGREMLDKLNIVAVEEVDALNRNTVHTVTGAMEQSQWKYTAPEHNRYFVEINGGKGNICTEYLCECELVVSDACERVLLNDTELAPERSDEYGFWYSIPEKLLRYGNNELVLEGTDKAFVYVIGDFAVKNRNPYYEFDSRQLHTENGFYIAEKGEINNDFILSGYPFSDEPIVCTKKIKCIEKTPIKIDCTHIAAAQVFLNEKNMGWVYEGNEYIKLDSAYEDVVITCKVYQSAFNIYGPHHHLEGDRPLISPMQYSGEKNFADTPSLPEYTLESRMKLVKWRMYENVEIVK